MASEKVVSDRWSRYADVGLVAGPVRLLYNAWMSHVPSLSATLRYQPPPARVISIGCGVGAYDILLAGFGYSVTSLDADARALEAAKNLSQSLGVSLDIRLGDAFDLHEYHGKYDLAFSAGLVEHWNGKRTVELLAEHARCAPLVQVEVPTRHTLLMGEKVLEVVQDMHFYTPREFRARIHEARLTVRQTYSTGTVPTRTRKVIENLLPPRAFKRFQQSTGYSMGIGCVATRLHI